MRTHEQVVAEIENRLNSGKLKAGDRLPPERQFAEALGVSRGAVRGARRILEALGVVEAGAGSGPTSGSRIVKDTNAGMGMVLRMHLQLASFTQDDLIETRLLLEQLACRKAAGVAAPTEVDHLRSLVSDMRGTHTSAGYHDLDTAFHVAIAQMSGNGLAAALMAAMREALRQAMVRGFENLGDPYFRTEWGSNVVGMILDDRTDWQELREVLTDSYCVQAPAELAGTINRPPAGD